MCISRSTCCAVRESRRSDRHPALGRPEDDGRRPRRAPSRLIGLLCLWAALAWMLAGNAGAFAREPLADADSLRASPEASTGIGAASRGFGRSDMVVAAHPAAVAAARDMLESGGGAVDAAIAAQMVLNLVEPQSSGIGGGGFLLHSSPKDGRVRVYDGRETAPAGVGEDLFLLPDGEVMGFFAAVDSGLSVGVPGLLRMLEQAHRDHGRLPWERLFEPAIDLARAGFPVSPRLHRLLTGALDRIRRSGSAARHYLDAAGRPWPVGHLLRDPEFADTLAMIAAGGADAFYRGSVAAAMVEAVRGDPRGPGRLAMTDLAGYRAVVREPVCGPFRGLRVCGAPPPSSGGITLLQSLGIFERLEPVALAAEPGSPMPAASMHRLVEAYRLAYADRSAWIADPDFFPVPRDGLLDAGYLGGRAKLVDDGRSMGMARAGQPPGAPPPVADPDRSLPSTTHLAIVDRHGEAVSLTSSIEHAFGNLLRVRGFLLNNQLTDFALSPVDADGGPLANRVEPGKRPRSTMAPTFVFDDDGRLLAALGSPGGSQIVQYVGKALVAMVDRRLPIDEAFSIPNFGAWAGASAVVESGPAGDPVARALAGRGHEVLRRAQTSGLHGFAFNGRIDGMPAPFAIDPGQGRWVGAADPRREGVAAGDR
ncbi:MAG: gamma-glutamyltransferase [Burkholderiaceae bacterium]|nr:gamma-glutamyltransferase [Burkholderiaceae bacterium]